MRTFFLLFLLCLLNDNIYGQTETPASDKQNADSKASAYNPWEDTVKRKKIVVTPTIVYFNTEAGRPETRTISVMNNTDKPYQFRLLMKDWERDSLGRHRYFLAGAHSRSCARWLTADKTFLEVRPGEVGRVNITMTIPDTVELSERGDTVNSNEMKWTMVLLETMTEKSVAQKHGKVTTKIGQAATIGVHIYQTPPALQNVKEVRMLSLKKLNDDRHYRIIAQNKGEAHLRCFFSIELMSQETGEKITLEEKAAPLFPLQERYVDFELPQNLAKGKYTMVAIVDAKDDEVPLEAAELEIEIN